MALAHSPKTTSDSLVLCLDAANIKSYLGTGTSVSNIVNNTLNGSLVNGVGFTSQDNYSFTFDGSNDYISLGNNFRYQDNFTLETVCKFPNLPNNPGSACGARHPIVYNHDYGYNLFVNSSGLINWNIYNTSSANKTVFSLSSVISSNYFHTIAIKSGTTISLYINSIFQSSDTLTSNAVYYISEPFTIGGYALCGPNRFYCTGNIALVKMYNRVLNVNEIQQNFNAVRKRFNI